MPTICIQVAAGVMQHGSPERHGELTYTSALLGTPAGPVVMQQTRQRGAWCKHSCRDADEQSSRGECSCAVTSTKQYKPAGNTERSAAKLESKPSRDCLRLFDGEAMLRRRVLLVRDTWRAVAGSLLVRRLLLRDSPLCALASRSAVSRRVVKDLRPCCQAAINNPHAVLSILTTQQGVHASEACFCTCSSQQSMSGDSYCGKRKSME